MKTLLVNQSQIKNEIQIPSSKSQTHRAILFASLAKQKSIIHHPLKSNDTLAMIEACRLLGATIDEHENHLEIQGIDGKVVGAEDIIHAHNSGIILRFISAIAALGSRPFVITGDHSIRHQRPMHTLLDALNQLGVRAESIRGNGFAPLIIQGPLKPGHVIIKNGADSQNVSALLIASAFLNDRMELTVHQPGEKPWVDLTLDWLERLGVSFENHQYEKYKIDGKGSIHGFEYTVPGDWSSAAFPLAAALITKSDLTIKNLDLNDKQGDKKILDIFTKMGAQFSTIDKDVHVHPIESLQGITVDINDCIDAITILGVLACFAKGETRLINASVARQKECDRITCLATELRKMGAEIREISDGLIIQGSSLKGAQVNSHNDHRMAMSLAVAGMGAIGKTSISGIDCIKKTYPTFVQDFQGIGAQFEEVS